MLSAGRRVVGPLNVELLTYLGEDYHLESLLQAIARVNSRSFMPASGLVAGVPSGRHRDLSVQ